MIVRMIFVVIVISNKTGGLKYRRREKICGILTLWDKGHLDGLFEVDTEAPMAWENQIFQMINLS